MDPRIFKSKAGQYSLSVQADGSADLQIAAAELTARQALRVDATLEVKSQSQLVEVSRHRRRD
jgi:hypothetical protein